MVAMVIRKPVEWFIQPSIQGKYSMAQILLKRWPGTFGKECNVTGSMSSSISPHSSLTKSTTIYQSHCILGKYIHIKNTQQNKIEILLKRERYKL